MYLNCFRYNEKEWNIQSKFYRSKYPYKLHAKPLLFLLRNMPVKPRDNLYDYRKFLEILEYQYQ